jgi:predicted component of type VI protein secretion system
MFAYLVPMDQKGLKIPLDKAIVFIGRHPECDIVLTRSRKVSRKHCAIAQVNNSFVIRDLGSMNGIRLNGEQVKREVRLSVGDEVSIGDLNYILTVEKPAEPEQRAERGHHEDARAAGSTARRAKRPPVPPEDLSRDVPVVIPEPGDDFEDPLQKADTPKSVPVVGDPPPGNADNSPLKLRVSENEFRQKGSQIGMRPE